jgi:4-amino-4-deoxy-L-arabinose transferase-like glycosyltransferase
MKSAANRPGGKPVGQSHNCPLDLLLLGVLWLFHVVLNAVWLRLDNYPPAWDSAHHLSMTLRWLAFWQTPSLADLRAVAAASSYPPLPYWLILPFYPLFGRGADVAVLANGAIWLGVLLVATFGLGRQVANRRVGLLAAALVSLYPLVVALQRDFLLDVALMAMVALSLWLLLRCGSFDHRGRAVALGLALGLGTLVKWPFPFFLGAPFLATLYLVPRRGGWSRLRLVNLGLCLAVAAGLAAARYVFNVLYLPGDLYNLGVIGQLVNSFASAAGHPPWYTLAGLLYYFSTLVNHQASFFFTVLFLAGMPAFLRGGARDRLVLGLSIAVPFILATLLPIKEQRITVPYLPSVAVITAVGLSSIRRKALRTGAIAVTLVVGLIQLWASSFGLAALPPAVYLRTSWIELGVFQQHPVQSPRDFQVQRADWKHHDLVETIRADAEAQGLAPPLQVPLVANTAACNPNTLNYYSLLGDAGIEFLYVWRWYDEPIDLGAPGYPYLVLKSGDNTGVEAWDQAGVEEAEAFLSERRADHELIYAVNLPDGSQIRLYRRNAGSDE